MWRSPERDRHVSGAHLGSAHRRLLILVRPTSRATASRSAYSSRGLVRGRGRFRLALSAAVKPKAVSTRAAVPLQINSSREPHPGPDSRPPSLPSFVVRR